MIPENAHPPLTPEQQEELDHLNIELRLANNGTDEIVVRYHRYIRDKHGDHHVPKSPWCVTRTIARELRRVRYNIIGRDESMHAARATALMVIDAMHLM